MDETTKLIFDIGLHTGRDSEFYLQKGFKVVGVEANPEMAARTAATLESYTSSGTLTIVERAIHHSVGQSVSFFINDEKDDWSSLFKGVAEKGVTSSREVTVETTTLVRLFEEFGVPYYLKCDIEGGDELVAMQLAAHPAKPQFVSFEITSVGILAALWFAGYRKFQLVNQAFNYLSTPPSPALEGTYVARQFDGHCSGLFGRELKNERWVDIDRVTELFLDFIRLRDRYEQLCMGWLDVHATW
jgi:FkbM family methyltransferase